MLNWSSFGLPSFVTILVITFVFLSSKKQHPPGPSGLPFLGVALVHPKTEYWKTYAEWSKKYSKKGLISFRVLGRHFIVLNKGDIATEMLDRSSNIYSDRPFPVMAGLLLRREKSIFFMNYGDRFRTYRRLMHQDFNSTSSQKYWSIQEAEARLLVHNLMSEVDMMQLEKHLRKNAAAVIMHIAYGYTVKDFDDYFVTLAEECMRIASLAMKPGAWLVDSFPILRFLPLWFPGAKFRRLADEWSKQLYTKSLQPHEFVKQQLAKGTAKPSFTSMHLQPPFTKEHEDMVFWTASALYAGAADSTVAVIKVFFYLMCLYPDIQQRAQEELDRVIGSDRLPNISDRPQLQFTNNVISEVLRWAPPGPLAPHSSSKDNIFEGYYIPKDSTVFANIWAILHDEEVYPEPHNFNPDRYTKCPEDTTLKVQPDPRQWVFGFGRRVCPGVNIAESSIFIQIVTILATLNIRCAVDAKGAEIKPKQVFSTGIASFIKSFPFRLSPRSSAAVILTDAAVTALD